VGNPTNVGYAPHGSAVAVRRANGSCPGTTVAPFENVDIFPLIVKILGLKEVPNDGDLKVLQGILRPHRAKSEAQK
jgi:hypothetical protein